MHVGLGINLVLLISHHSYQALNMVLLYPLAGWIADVYTGRYKLIRNSMRLMWTTMLITTALLTLQHGYPDKRLSQVVNYGALPLAMILMNIGLAGFKVNIIPFGIDQLQDAPSEQFSTFIHWFVWTIFLSVGLDTFLTTYVPMKPGNLLLIQSLFQTFCLTVAISSDLIFHHWLSVKPGCRNPLKKVVQVLKYASKHKYPQNRSAFTYGEDRKPSRVDFAKEKYGGMFLTEQVEDVKAFLRIVLILLSLFGFFTNNIAAFRVIRLLGLHMMAKEKSMDYSNTATNVCGSNVLLFIIISIPIYELLIQPIFYKYIPTMLKRVGIGVCLVAASLSAQLALDVVLHMLNSEPASCIFKEHPQPAAYIIDSNQTSLTNELQVSYLWLYIPSILNALAMMLVLIGIFEFICAQSPFAMKGLLFGVFYCSNGLFLLLGLFIKLAFQVLYMNEHTARFPPCGFWYYLLNIAIAVVGLALFVGVARCYHNRKRDEVWFEQTVAEEVCERNLGRS